MAKKTFLSDGWREVGEIGVDAGMCWIGDPCYILHRQGDNPKDIGENWDDFCNKMSANDTWPASKQFNYDAGHAGLGVVVTTGYGDGVYPVLANFKGGRVMEL